MDERIKDLAPAAASVSRRSILKRGAAAGGAAVVFTPVVQVVGLTPASAQNPSVIVPPEEPTDCHDISNIQVVVTGANNNGYYGLKFDPGDQPGEQFVGWDSAAPDSNDCIRYYETQSGKNVSADDQVAQVFNRGAVVDLVSDCQWRLRLPLPDGFTFVSGWVKYGNVSTGGCPHEATVTPTYVEFKTF